MCLLDTHASTCSPSHLRNRAGGGGIKFFLLNEKTGQYCLSPSHVTSFGSWHITPQPSCRLKVHPCWKSTLSKQSSHSKVVVAQASRGHRAQMQSRIMKERQDKCMSEGACWSCSQWMKFGSGEGQCLRVFSWPLSTQKQQKNFCVWFPTNSVQIVKNSLFFPLAVTSFCVPVFPSLFLCFVLSRFFFFFFFVIIRLKETTSCRSVGS